jgi:hypothetical protein
MVGQTQKVLIAGRKALERAKANEKTRLVEIIKAGMEECRLKSKPD